MRFVYLMIIALFIFAAPPQAQAHSDSFAYSAINVRAGPGRYPIVTRIEPRSRVTVLGCLRGWGWCEVVANGVHGWAAANLLGGWYNRREVTVAAFGPYLDIPFITWEQRPYWDRYYSNRDFYVKVYGYKKPVYNNNWRHDDDNWNHEHDWDHGRHDGAAPAKDDHHNDHHDDHHDNNWHHDDDNHWDHDRH